LQCGKVRLVPITDISAIVPAPVPPILPLQNGFLTRDKAKFAAFAADVDPQQAAFMTDAQIPWGLEALNGTISQPAWKGKPSYRHTEFRCQTYGPNFGYRKLIVGGFYLG
jgi:hypothetical protein